MNMHMTPHVSTLLLAMAAVTLSACGGGGGSGGTSAMNSPGSTSGTPTTTTPTTAGVWKGTIGSTATGQSSVMVGLNGADGHVVWMASDGRVFDGTVPMTGSQFESQMTVHVDDGGHLADGTTVGVNSMTIDSHTASMMGGRYSGSGDSGTFSMNLSTMWDRMASMTTVAGTYTRSTSTGYTMTMTIDANGQITGSDTAGCLVNGTASVPDATHNLYRMDVTVTVCGALNGSYHGMGALLDADAMQDWMSAMPGFQMMGGSSMMGGSPMMGHNTMPSGQHNLFMFSVANDQYALMDALAR